MLETRNYFSIDVGFNSFPVFTDIDGDGDLDLFIGERDGKIFFYRNTGSVSNANFVFESDNFAAIDVGNNSVPFFIDIDQDSDQDLFVGARDGTIDFYRNNGTAMNASFVLDTENLGGIDVGGWSVPAFSDIDNDGDFDLFIGEEYGGVHFYRNLTNNDILISLPNTSGAITTDVAIPVKLNKANGVTAVEATLTHNTNVLHVVQVNTSDATSGFTLLTDLGTAGSVGFTLSGTTPLNGQNIDLVEIVYKVNGSVGDTTSLKIASATLNNGIIPVMAKNGSFTVTALAPEINLSKSKLDFGSVPSGSTKVDSFAIANLGAAELSIVGISRTSGSNDFDLLSPVNFPVTLPPGSQPLSVKVGFTASSLGAKNAIFTILSNDSIGPVVLTVEGTAVSPPASAISLSDTTLAFKNVFVGSSRQSSLIISNVGNTELIIHSIARTSEFSLASSLNFPISLQPNDTPLSVFFKFSPTTAGVKSANFTISSNDTNGAVEVSLTGNGIFPPLPAMRLSRTSIDFGDVAFDDTKIESFTIENAGDRDLDIFGIAQADSNSDFLLTSPTRFPARIQPNATPLTVKLSFSPSSTTDKNTIFTISSNDTSGSAEIIAHGRGVLPDSPSRSAPTMRLYLTGDGKMLDEVREGATFGHSQDIDNDAPEATWGPFILNNDMVGNDYNLNIWALSPRVNGVQTSTNFRTEILVNEQIVASFDFTADRSSISSGLEF